MVTHSLRGQWVWKKARIGETPSQAASLSFGLQLSEEQGPLVVRLSLSHLLQMPSLSPLGKELTGVDGRQQLLPSAPRRMDVLAEVLILWVGGEGGRWIPPQMEDP